MRRTEPVLRFVGPAVTGAPARDLMLRDLTRIAYRRALSLTIADGVRPPRQPTPAQIADVVRSLTIRGRYVQAKPRKEA